MTSPEGTSSQGRVAASDLHEVEVRLIEMVRRLRWGSLMALRDFLDANETGQGGMLVAQAPSTRSRPKRALVEIGYASENWTAVVPGSIEMRMAFEKRR